MITHIEFSFVYSKPYYKLVKTVLSSQARFENSVFSLFVTREAKDNVGEKRRSKTKMGKILLGF